MKKARLVGIACVVGAASCEKAEEKPEAQPSGGAGGFSSLFGAAKGEKKGGGGKEKKAEPESGAAKGLTALLGGAETATGKGGDKKQVKMIDLLRQLRDRRAELEKEEAGPGASDRALLVVPEIKVVVFADREVLPPAALRRQLLKMNAGIYDATEGQVRVGRFSVYSKRAGKGEAQVPGTIHIHREWAGADEDIAGDPHHGKGYAGMSDMLGTPRKPSRIHAAVFIDGRDYTFALGQILAHEFMHAFLNVADEYAGPYGAPSNGCPDRVHTCIMDGFWGKELCTPGNHDADHDTRQQSMNHESCWETVRRMVKAANGKNIVIPDQAKPGPRDPPAPAFRGDYR